MVAGTKRPRLSGSSGERDVLRQLLHTGTVSMNGLKKLVGIIKESGLSPDEEFGMNKLRQANSERSHMQCLTVCNHSGVATSIVCRG